MKNAPAMPRKEDSASNMEQSQLAIPQLGVYQDFPDRRLLLEAQRRGQCRSMQKHAVIQPVFLVLVDMMYQMASDRGRC